MRAGSSDRVGQALFGDDWRGELGPAIGVSRAHGYTVAKHGADKLVAASLVGLIARTRVGLQREHEAAVATLDGLLERLEGRVG